MSTSSGAAASSSRAATPRPRSGGFLGGAIGVLGELMLTVGVLLVLFLVWQLWWTDVIADRDQDQLISQLDDQWGAVDQEKIAEPRYDDPPPPPAVSDTTVFATMHVPTFDRPRVPIAEGIGMEEVLNVKGMGHYPETALPGEVGNVSLAGHRNTYGRPLEDIARLQEGDPIVIETEDAFYVYEVTEHRIVDPSAVEVIAETPGEPGVEATERMLTLTACHPMFSARERYIVHAKFAYWTDRDEGIPPALATKES